MLKLPPFLRSPLELLQKTHYRFSCLLLLICSFLSSIWTGRNIVHVLVKRMSVLIQPFKRYLTTSVSSLSRKTVVYSNGVVASWHPAEPVPYEKTKPIPVTDSVDTSVLAHDVSSLPRDLRNGPTNVDLKEIFYTDKNEWYSRTREDRLRSVAGPRSKRH